MRAVVAEFSAAKTFRRRRILDGVGDFPRENSHRSCRDVSMPGKLPSAGRSTVAVEIELRVEASAPLPSEAWAELATAAIRTAMHVASNDEEVLQPLIGSTTLEVDSMRQRSME